MTFSPEYLLQQLPRQPRPPCYWVAYSGGLDSHVLLHALVGLRVRLDTVIGAVHVNHGLQADAGRWEDHCRRTCVDLDVEYVSLCVDGRARSGESPEAAAREARYAALADWLPAGHCLLTAQHRDDQAETLLLQLLRGSGVHGLAAMPPAATLGAGQQLRPLLAVTRQTLHAYAVAEGLSWVEDASNREMAFDRNFLRLQILPALRQRWPAVTASLSRSARHCAEAAEQLDEVAAQDLQNVASHDRGSVSLTGLAGLPAARQRNALRSWIRQGCGTAPSTAVLARIMNDVLASRRDALPCVRWGACEVRRYRDDLFLLPRSAVPDSKRVLRWGLREPLQLPDALGVLRALPGTGRGIREAAVGSTGVRIGWRQGGERLQPAGRDHHHSLKKLFQEQGIPPWKRARIPLIYIDGALAAVAGLWVDAAFQAGPGEAGLLIDWQDSLKNLQ
jgi:tRNA(Ile)-lysidine synthase